MKAITLVNDKGGVGKTTVSYGLASILAYLSNKGVPSYKRKKVLMIDMDHQSALSKLCLGEGYYEIDQKKQTIMRLFYDPAYSGREIILPTKQDYLEIVPASRMLSATDVMSKHFSYDILKNFLSQLEEEYEYVIIDNHPDYALNTRISLYTADYIILPVVPETLAITGIKEILEVLDSLEEVIGKKINVIGTFANKVDERLKVHKNNLKSLKGSLKDNFFDNFIHESAVIKSALEEGKTIIEIYKANRSYREFKKLAEECIERIEKHEKSREKEGVRWWLIIILHKNIMKKK